MMKGKALNRWTSISLHAERRNAHINHEYRMDMIWHHDVPDDFNVLVVNIQSSQVGIDDGADREQMHCVVNDLAQDRGSIVRAGGHEVPATRSVVPTFETRDSIRYLFLNRVNRFTVCWTALAIFIRFARG